MWRRTPDRPTGAGLIVLNEAGENFILLDMGANEAADAAFVERAEPMIEGADVVMSVLEIPVEAAARAMEIGRRHSARTVLNPAPARALPDEMFPLVDYLTPNERRAADPAGPAGRRPAPLAGAGR